MKQNNKCWLKHYYKFKYFIECSSIMDDIYKNIKEHSSKKEREIWLLICLAIKNINK